MTGVERGNYGAERRNYGVERRDYGQKIGGGAIVVHFSPMSARLSRLRTAAYGKRNFARSRSPSVFQLHQHHALAQGYVGADVGGQGVV